jgi:glycosyltransferase involved in cell wall biosynthesis
VLFRSYEIDLGLRHIAERFLYGSTLYQFYKRCPVPVVSTLHTIFPNSEYKAYMKEKVLRKEGRFSYLPVAFRAIVRKWIMERRFQLLQEVVSASCEIVNLAATTREIIHRGVVIYHGAEPAIPFISDKYKTKLRKEFGLPTGKRLLLAFGYVGSYKGFDLLNNIVVPNGWSLVIKQNIHERGVEVPAKINNAINLHLNYLDDVTVSKLFFACDAIIFPYKVVSVSGVLFDAIAHGLPFVASDLKFFKEFSDKELGITCNRDAVSFSLSLARLDADYEKYKKNLSKFSVDIRWENVAKSHIAIYSKLKKEKKTFCI